MKVAVEMQAANPCDPVDGVPKCGAHGTCTHLDDGSGGTRCQCETGWRTPASDAIVGSCLSGECMCSEQDCAVGCAECASAAGVWLGTAPRNCTRCDADTAPFWTAFDETLQRGECADACPATADSRSMYPAADSKVCTACHSTCGSCRAPVGLRRGAAPTAANLELALSLSCTGCKDPGPLSKLTLAPALALALATLTLATLSLTLATLTLATLTLTLP